MSRECATSQATAASGRQTADADAPDWRLRWIALAGGVPAAAIVRAVAGPAYRGLCVPSLLLHMAAVGWSSVALLGAELFRRRMPDLAGPAGLGLATASAVATVCWLCLVSAVAASPDSPLAARLRPARLERWLLQLEGILAEEEREPAGNGKKGPI